MPLVPEKQEYEAVVSGPGQSPGTEITVGKAPISIEQARQRFYNAAPTPPAGDMAGMPDPEPAVVTSLRQAAGVNPDAAARALRLESASGIPVQQTMEDKDLDDLAANLPDLKALSANQATSLYLQNPRNAAVAKDDVPTLTGFERAVRLFADGYRRSQITNQMYQTAYDLMQSGGKDEKLLAEVRRLQKEAESTLQPQGWMEEAGAGAVEFATQMGLGFLDAAPSALVGGAAGSVIPGVGTGLGFGVGMTVGMADYMRRLEAGSAYWQYINEGVSHDSAQLGAGLAGLVNAAVESLQVGQAVKAFPGGKALLQKGLRTAIKEALSSPKLAGVLKNFALRQGKFTLAETAEEGAQQLVTDAIGEYLKGTPYAEWWNNIAPDVAETMRKAGLGIGALGLVGHGLGLPGQIKAAKRFSPDAAKVVEAIDGLNQGKLAQRSPQALEEFVEGVVKETNTPTRVYFDPQGINTLFQTQEIMVEDAADVLEQAGVNLADFNERMGLGLPISMEVKKLPGFLATTIGQAVKNSITYVPEVIENKALMRLAEESGLPMPAELMAQAETRFKEIGVAPAVAKTWAALLGARARVVASQTGMDPNDYLTQGPYKWVFQGEGGEAAPDQEPAAAAPPELQPKLFTQRHPEGVPVEYLVVDTSDVVPSHDPLRGFAPRPEYPPNVQERDYPNDKAEQFKVVSHAQRLNALYLLSNNPDPTNGPPMAARRKVIDPKTKEEKDKFVLLGGNSRGMSIMLAYAEYPEKAAEYKQMLGHFAPDTVAGLPEPMLIRVIDIGNLDEKELHRWATDLNYTPTQAMGEEAQAASRGRNVAPATLERIGNLLSQEDETVRGLLDKPTQAEQILAMLRKDGVISPTDASKYWNDKFKKITEEGKRVVEATLLGSVLPDPELLQVAPRWTLQVLGRNLAALSQIQARGEEWNIAPQLREAVELITAMEGAGFKTLDEFLRQGFLPGMAAKQWDPKAEVLANALLTMKQNQLRDALAGYAQDAKLVAGGQKTLVAVDPAESFDRWFGRGKKPDQLFQPLNPDVDLDQPVKVVQAEPQLEGKKPHEWRKGEGRRELRERLAGTYRNHSADWEINLSGQAVDHALSSAGKSPVDPSIALEAVANLPALIENAVLVESHQDLKAEEGLKQVHRFFAGFSLEDKTYAVKITVKEYKKTRQAALDGVYRAYDSRLEKEVPGGPRRLPSPTDSGTGPTPGTENNISQTSDDVKKLPAGLVPAVPKDSTATGAPTGKAPGGPRQPPTAEAVTTGPTPSTDISLRQLLDGVKDHLGEPYTLFQSGPAFYSQLQRTTEEKLPNSGTGQSFAQAVKSWAQKGLFKQEELEWSDLEAWLASLGDKKITKEDVVSFLEANQIRVEEVQKGGKTLRFRSVADYERAIAEAEGQGNFNLAEELTLEMEEVGGTPPQGAEGAKFSTYTLPGGENYRELLLTLPIKSSNHPNSWHLVGNAEETEYAGKDMVDIVDANGKVRFTGTPEDASRYLREESSIAGERQDQTGQTYKSAHWDERNVVAHVRFNERRSQNGKRILFIEEIQSDWHQEGRRKGYLGEKINTEGWTAQKAPISPEQDANGNLLWMWEVFDSYGQGKVIVSAPTEEAAIKKSAEEDRELSGGVPHAPFKTTWPMLAFKRMIRWAAENGFDQIAWTPGEVQAERYDLSKHLDRIEYDAVIDDDPGLSLHPQPTGEYDFVAYAKDGQMVIEEEEIGLDRIEELAGKEIAQKIQEGQGRSLAEERPLRPGWMSLEGLDLKVGGEGMRAFYDKMLPSMVNKYVKKWGAKVETIRLEVDREERLLEAAFKEKAKEGLEVWSVPVTPAMREAALAGQPLFQDRVKGAVTFDEGQAIITLFKNADPTTLPHEAFHVFRREMEAFATDPYIPRNEAARIRQETLKADWQAACEFVGAKVGQAWTREQEEMFARAGEQALLEGKIPVPALRGLFSRMRQWFLDIYRAIKDGADSGVPGVELSDEMRGVFDRLLATEQDIKLAQAQELAAPTITEAPAGADPAWWQAHQKQAARAALSAEDNIAQKRMGDVTASLPKWKDEALEAAREHPGQRLLSDIMARGGLNHAALALAYDPQVIAQLRQKRVGLVRKEGGITLEDLAREKGTAPAEVLATIINTPNQAQLIKAYIYAKQMEAERGLTAEELAITDSALELQRMEADYLAGRAPGVEKADIDAPAQAFEDTAHEEVAALTEEDPATVRAAMSKEAQIAKEAYLAGDMARAAEAKKKEMAAAARLRERLNSRREIAAARAYFEKVVRAGTSGEYSPAGIEDSYLQQIRAILSRYLDLPRGAMPRPGVSALTSFLSEMPESIRPQIPDEIIEGMGDYAPQPLAKLKFGALMNLKDAVTALETMGKNEKLLISFEKNVAFDKARDEIWRAIEDNHEVKPPPDAPAIWKNLSPAKRALAWVNKFLAANTKVEFIARRLDGFKSLGDVQKYLFGQIKRAEDRQIRTLQEADRRLKAAFAAVPSEIRNKWSKKRLTPEIPQGELTGEQIVMVGMNSGNKGNREATRLGWGWTKEGYEAVLARITPEEWRLVYEVWGTIEDVFPHIDETHYKMFGTHLEKVMGSYFPLVFDRRASWKAEQFQQAEAERDFWQNTYAVPATRRGFTIARKGGKLPPLLEFSVISRHLYDTVHHATHALAVRDVYKLINDPLVKNTIVGAVGEDAYKQLMPWLQEVARPDRGPVNILENVAGYVRAGYTAAVLGYAIQTVIQQPLALFNAVPELGLGAVLKGMTRLGPEASEFIKNKSAYMSQRRQAMDREIKSRLQSISPTAKTYQKITSEYAYAMMGFTDQLAAQSVWLAAYDQGMKQSGGDEPMAIDHADGVVRRTQGSAMAKDLPAIQRGSEFTKAGTMFLTFFNSVFNLMQEAGYKFQSDHDFLDLAKSYLWLVAVPAVLGSMAIERERWKPKDALLALITYPMTALPILREASSLVNALAGDRGFDYRGGPLGAVFQGVVETGRAISAEHPKGRNIAKKAAPVVGTLTKLPSNQAMVTIEGILDMLGGETKNPMHLVLRRRKERR